MLATNYKLQSAALPKR